MLLRDEDVGNGRLAGQLSKSRLDSRAIICAVLESDYQLSPTAQNRIYCVGFIHTNLVQLNGVELGTLVAQQLLCLAAVGAVRFREDGDGVLVDDGLNLGLCGGHCGWTGGAAEEAADEEGNGCGC